MSSPFAALPTELVLAVLSFAADDQPTALALSLVSSWVRAHIERALYHTVRLRSARALAAFLAALDRKPDGFADRTVRRLCVTALGPIASIQTVLARCTGVTSLACGFSAPSYVHHVLGPSSDGDKQRGAFGRLPVHPSEQHLLALACRDGLDMAIVSPAVSRLRIQLTPAVTPASVAQLAALPRLTHLAVVYAHGHPGGPDAVSDVLRPIVEGGRLRVLALQVVGGSVDAILEEVRRWKEIREDGGSSRRSVDGEKNADLIVTAGGAPRFFLSEWEDSDRFWQRARDGAGSVTV